MQDQIDETLERLARVMATTPNQVGVAMGHELFRECAKRNLIVMKTFSILGTGFLPHDLPTYGGTNFAFVHPNLTDWDFQIGTPRHA